MIGLIKKDLLMIKSNFKIFIILFLAYGFMAFQGEMSLSFVLPFMSIMIMTSTFSYDTYNKWDAYSITLPDGRKNSVRAKYLATLLLVVVTTIIVTILSIVIAYIQTKEINFEEILSTIIGALFSTTLLQSFMYPSIYKFGVEKARIGIFIIAIGMAIIIGTISRFVNFESMFQTLDNLGEFWIIIFPILMIVMLYISYKISESIYKKKEY